MLPPPPRFPLFPYTTLFRSLLEDRAVRTAEALELVARGAAHPRGPPRLPPCGRERRDVREHERDRSEEHTSELQSLRHLVCRLLLEKKKKHKKETKRYKDTT